MFGFLMAACLMAPIGSKDVRIVAVTCDSVTYDLDLPRLVELEGAGIQVKTYDMASKKGQKLIKDQKIRLLPYYILYIDDPNDRVDKFRPVAWGPILRDLTDFLQTRTRIGVQ